jgi:hypothetical protein
MHLFTYTLPLALVAMSAHGAPLQSSSNAITASSIIKVAPETSTCANCPAPGECRTAAIAAPNLAISFINFHISTFNAQAALLALILYESDNFKYSKNHFPGVPGQGTRNMQSPEYNLKYAQWLATVCTNCGITSEEVGKAQQAGPEKVLELVNGNEWSFGSAAWFLSTQCDASVKAGLDQGTQAAWEQYLTGCIGTTVTEDRNAVWKKVMALKHW